jgi:hypothetical protein
MQASVRGQVLAIAMISLVLASGCVSAVSPLPIGSPPPGSASPIASTLSSTLPSDAPSTSEPAPEASVEEPVASEEPAPSEEMDGTAGPGCGTGQQGLFAHRDEVPRELHFGGATIEFTTAAIGLRNGTYTADDAIPGGLGLTPDEIAVVVAPGAHIILRGTGLTLTKVHAASGAWTDVSFSDGLASWSVSSSELTWRRRDDGSISVSAPDVKGDYAVELGPSWHSDCLVGDGSSYSRIKVR